MMKTQIGLGVLSFPSIFHTLGIVPGAVLMCVIAGMTTWSNYIVGVFKLKHREVYGIDDAGQLIFGRIGREIGTIAFMGCKQSLQTPSLTSSVKLANSGRIRVDRRLRYTEYFYLPQRPLRARSLYSHLCRRGFRYRMLSV